jgi:phenylalanyl-tRNA synthetase alpha chain
MSLQESLNQLKDTALAAFAKATTARELYDVKVQFLGKNGSFSNLMKEMGKLSKEERPTFGALVNEAKNSLESHYAERESQLKKHEIEGKLASEKLDLTLRFTKWPRRFV